MNNRRALPNDKARQYLLSGNAILTFKNTQTMGRFTFKVSYPKNPRNDQAPHFVAVLTGPDNTSNYKYFGNIWPDGTLKMARRAKIGPNALAVRSFAYLWEHIDELPEHVEVWHHGFCLRCGRQLTVPESIASGYGPDCMARLNGGA